MKKLTLKSNAFQQGEVLTRTQLKKVMGGDGSDFGDACLGKEGIDLENCRYQVCLYGWVMEDHTEQQNQDKLDSCCALAPTIC